jgi:hypothetical protein
MIKIIYLIYGLALRGQIKIAINREFKEKSRRPLAKSYHQAIIAISPP